jgi:hypothetical protein
MLAKLFVNRNKQDIYTVNIGDYPPNSYRIVQIATCPLRIL